MCDVFVSSPASQPSSTNLSMTPSLDPATHVQQQLGHRTDPLDGDTGGVERVKRAGSGSKVVQRSKPSDQSRPQSAAKSRSA